MPVYSHSRLNSFENCPLQYRYRYVERIRTDFESIEAFMGKRVHEVLEAVYSDLARARAGGLEASLERYERLWDENLSGSVRVIRPDLDADYYRRQGARCLESYWSRHHPFRVEPGKIIGLEMKVELNLDPAGRIRMMGYVDRAQHAEPGVIEIHDYKTTATLPREGSLRFDRQLPLYEMALRQRFPSTREVRLIWHFLAHGTESVETRRPEDLDRIRRSTISLIQTVERARDFPAKKGPLCAWCEYQEICPEWKGARPAAPPAFPNGRPVEMPQPAAASASISSPPVSRESGASAGEPAPIPPPIAEPVAQPLVDPAPEPRAAADDPPAPSRKDRATGQLRLF